MYYVGSLDAAVPGAGERGVDGAILDTGGCGRRFSPPRRAGITVSQQTHP